MRLKVTDPNGNEQIIEAQSVVLGDGSFLDGANGAAHVRAMELGIENFESVHSVITPLNTFDFTFTVPAGCYTIKLTPVITTGGTVTAFAGNAFFRVNASVAALTGANVLMMQAGDDPVWFGVKPGDVVHYTGDATTAGQIRLMGLG